MDLSIHYTDDGESTACAEFPVDALPDDEELTDNVDELTCPTCKKLLTTIARVSYLRPSDVQEE